MTSRPTPTWYDDAKIDIFVHWRLYSVPGWAIASGTLDERMVRLVNYKEDWMRLRNEAGARRMSAASTNSSSLDAEADC